MKHFYSALLHPHTHTHTHTLIPTFLSFVEAVLSIEIVAMVIQGTHGEKRRSKTS